MSLGIGAKGIGGLAVRPTIPGLNTLNAWRVGGSKAPTLGYRVVTVLCIPGNLVSLVAHTALTLVTLVLKPLPFTRPLNDYFWVRAENSWDHLYETISYDLLGL